MPTCPPYARGLRHLLPAYCSSESTRSRTSAQSASASLIAIFTCGGAPRESQPSIVLRLNPVLSISSPTVIPRALRSLFILFCPVSTFQHFQHNQQYVVFIKVRYRYMLRYTYYQQEISCHTTSHRREVIS